MPCLPPGNCRNDRRVGSGAGRDTPRLEILPGPQKTGQRNLVLHLRRSPGKLRQPFSGAAARANPYPHWINYKYGLVGYLHWGLNFWGSDPLTSDASRDRGKLPAGDANITYPGYRKLYSSIRLEAMRDGIYDYELLKMLERKNPGKRANTSMRLL